MLVPDVALTRGRILMNQLGLTPCRKKIKYIYSLLEVLKKAARFLQTSTGGKIYSHFHGICQSFTTA